MNENSDGKRIVYHTYFPMMWLRKVSKSFVCLAKCRARTGQSIRARTNSRTVWVTSGLVVYSRIWVSAKKFKQKQIKAMKDGNYKDKYNTMKYEQFQTSIQVPAGNSFELLMWALAGSSSSERQIKRLRLALKTASFVFVANMFDTITSTKPSRPNKKKIGIELPPSSLIPVW